MMTFDEWFDSVTQMVDKKHLLSFETAKTLAKAAWLYTQPIDTENHWPQTVKLVYLDTKGNVHYQPVTALDVQGVLTDPETKQPMSVSYVSVKETNNGN